MKEKKKNIPITIIKYIFFTLFITYVALYFSSATGYYDYEQHKKVSLTKEKIKQFESDVENGKNLDISNYLEATNKDYQNNTSQFGYNISNKIGKIATTGIEKTFSFLSKIFDE